MSWTIGSIRLTTTRCAGSGTAVEEDGNADVRKRITCPICSRTLRPQHYTNRSQYDSDSHFVGTVNIYRVPRHFAPAVRAE